MASGSRLRDRAEVMAEAAPWPGITCRIYPGDPLTQATRMMKLHMKRHVGPSREPSSSSRGRDAGQGSPDATRNICGKSTRPAIASVKSLRSLARRLAGKCSERARTPRPDHDPIRPSVGGEHARLKAYLPHDCSREVAPSRWPSRG